MLHCVAVRCSVLQCVAVCCSVLREYDLMTGVAALAVSEEGVLWCVAVCCGVLHFVVVCCGALQCVLQRVAAHGRKT